MVRLKVASDNVEVLIHEFQFHYGTIKRMWKPLQYTTSSNFNSTMVRLKAACDVLDVAREVGFQFHYGTIKRLRCLLQNTNLLYFNSTMVRLKVRCLRRKSTRLRNFNSTMVRLKACKPRKNKQSCRYFNSTMVRLKVLIHCFSFFVILFQFHYGTIKSYRSG